jgi:hypothetical protein
MARPIETRALEVKATLIAAECAALLTSTVNAGATGSVSVKLP